MPGEVQGFDATFGGAGFRGLAVFVLICINQTEYLIANQLINQSISQSVKYIQR